jgi:hypothetical protein
MMRFVGVFSRGMSRRKLMKQGAETSAVVLQSEPLHMNIAERDWRMRLRVHLPDGSQSEATCTENSTDVGDPSPGVVFPVRYDPNAPERVEIDIPAVKARREAELRQWDSEAIARADQSPP